MEYILSDGELYHYGVLGMKWGVHRARSKSASNERLRKKALKYDKKSAQMTKKSEKIHADRDLESSNRKAVKAATYDKRAANLARKALNSPDGVQRSMYEKRSEKNKYKAQKARLASVRISKATGYGGKAMKYAIKSDKAALAAAKARKQIASNEAYIAAMNRKVSSLTPEERQEAYAFVNALFED